MGYGMFQLQHPVTGKNGKRLAHRVSYEIRHGPIPRGATPQSNIVLHTCDNPACVNPAHLRLGNMKANYDDMAAKGRRRVVVPLGDAHWTRQKPEMLRRGEDNPLSKLTEADVRAIYQRRLAGADYSAIAREIGMDASAVADICRGDYWAHLLGTPGCPTREELLAIPPGKSGRRLTAETATAIRQGAAAGMSGATLARMHGCSVAVACDIIKRRSWRHLP